jgi:molybdopterin converting factor small subunit
MPSRSADGVTDAARGAGPAGTVPVLIPGILRSYTAGADRIDLALPGAAGEGTPTVGAVLGALDARCPGLRFRIVDEQGRIRAHIKIFCAGELVRDLAAPVQAGAEVMLVGALSGG